MSAEVPDDQNLSARESDNSAAQQQSAEGPSQQAGRARSDVLLDQSLAMLVPLVKVLVANGVTYPQFVASLKPIFLRAAHAELSTSGRRISDSAISIVSGVHRKDVRAMMSEIQPRKTDRLLSLAGEVIARWANDARYVDDDGLPRALPLRNGAGSVDPPSFEQLTQSVSRDLHSRAVLEELSRLGVIEVTDDVAHLHSDRWLADSSFVETLLEVTRNVHDHLAAIESNLYEACAGDPSLFLEQSMSAEALGAESIRALQDLSRRIWESALRRMAGLATDSVERDRRLGGDQAMRMRFGVYFYAEPESPLARDDELPPAG